MKKIAMRDGKRRHLRREAFALLKQCKEPIRRSEFAPLLGVSPDVASRILQWLRDEGYADREGKTVNARYTARRVQAPPKSRWGKHPNSRANLVTYEYAKGLRAIMAARKVRPRPIATTALEQCWPSPCSRILTVARPASSLDTRVLEMRPEYSEAAD